MDDGSDHRVVDGREICPVLVHGEWCALLRRLLEEFGMVHHNVVTKNGPRHANEFGLHKRLHPFGGVLLDVVGVQDDLVGPTQSLHLWARPCSIDVLACRGDLPDYAIEIAFQLTELIGGEDALGEVEAVSSKSRGDLGLLRCDVAVCHMIAHGEGVVWMGWVQSEALT